MNVRSLLRYLAVAGVVLLGAVNPLAATAPAPAAAVQLRLGVDFPASELAEHLAWYPSMGYTRHFGVDYDRDGRPELPNTSTDAKWRALPPSTVIHVSWKDSVEQLGPWLSTVDRPILLTWWHEPMGDVPPATYRQTAARMAQIIANHPNRSKVLGNGPVLTRYWLDEGRGNPADWWYPGATLFGVDSYKPAGATSYPSGSYMFDRALSFAASKGVPLVVGEFGSGLISTDTTGAGRALAIRGWITYLQSTGRCTFAGWFDLNAHKLTPSTPHELATLQTAVALLAAR